MNADKMFEELGFTKHIYTINGKHAHIDYRKKYDEYDFNDKIIEFYKSSHNGFGFHISSLNTTFISINEFNAITQKLKELHWI